MSVDIMTVIMAAGEGTRMKSNIPKVLHKICGTTMIERIIKTAIDAFGIAPVVVLGKNRDMIQNLIQDRAQIVIQEQQKGTGHAVLMAADILKKHDGYTVILAGDMPLIQPETLKNLVDITISQGNDATLLTAVMPDPFGYGRIIRDQNGLITGIVEQADVNAEKAKINEINASVYCFKSSKLLDALGKISSDNAQKEYYLTDCISVLVREGGKVGGLCVPFKECIGINNRAQLATAQAVLRKRICNRLMLDGVTIINPDSTYIDDDVVIGRDTVIYPNTFITGNSKIGKDCTILPNCRIDNSIIGDGSTVESSVILDSVIGRRTTVGPFAYIRPGSRVGDKCKIGDFVELKNTTVNNNSKIPHLCYAGDCDIGENCNIACGTIFVNYDGKDKHRTKIGDNCFVGCNVNLVAPVEVKNGAYIAAGTTVTEDVPENALSIGRVRQTIKPDWANQRRAKGKLK